jgi:phosphoglycerol transferase MdoB-like AlkP superfamily enzyme
MISSASKTQLIWGIFGWILVSLTFSYLYKLIVIPKLRLAIYKSWKEFPIFLLIFGALVIPIRGGFQLIPINQSNVYFSENMFANHASLNFTWNFFNTIAHKTDGKNPYISFPTVIANTIIENSRKPLLIAPKTAILTTSKPNIILILWESLSAKVVGSLGGEPDVTPNLDCLAQEGMLFTNFYSNGDRTDKGIPAILSGYYPQPVERIMRMPNKTRSLTMLPKKMYELGYETSYYYGGDLNFGNMNTYLRNAGISKIVDGNEFDEDDWNSKWGAHDDVFMQRFEDDLSTEQKEPFFKIALTLSSHEPFEIKGNYKFGKDTEDNLFRSAHHFTDSIVGKFVDFAKTQAWYENTLIVIMADHGHTLPIDKSPNFSPKKFHIPMLWLGGALKKSNKKITTVSSQVDFSYTLLQLLNGDVTGFDFGKNIFQKGRGQYAHYTFNKGFGTLTKDGVFVYDFVSNTPILSEGKNTKKLDSLGKAITQMSYQDFLDRK